MVAKTDRTTCKWGHPWIAENLIKNSAGITVCRLCLKRYTKDFRAKKKARVGRLHVQSHCAKGHEFTPDNTRVIQRNAKDGSTSTFKQCLKCLAARHALVVARKAAQPPPKGRGEKSLRERCKAKGHPLRGHNLIERVDPRTGVTARICRACRNEYMKEREYAKRHGLPMPRRRRDYPSLEAKVIAETQVTDGCHIWLGKTSGPKTAKAPVVAWKSEYASVRPWLCERAGRTIPPKHRCVMRAGCHKMCVRLDHIEILSWAQQCARFQTKETRERARQTMLKKFGGGRDQYMRDIFAHHTAVRSAVKRKLKVQSEIDDVVQDTMLAAYNHWLTKRGPIENLKSFLITTAMNKVIDVSRKSWHRKRQELPTYRDSDGEENESDFIESTFAAPPEHTDPYLLLQRAEVDRLRMRILKDRMSEIPAKARTCLMMKLDECSQKDIAAKLCVSENTVEQHLRKAYNILRGSATQKWDKRGRRDSYFLDSIIAA